MLHSSSSASVKSDRREAATSGTAGTTLPAGSDVILYRKFEDEETVTILHFLPDAETLARYILANPAIYTILFGVGTRAFLDQFFKLWPEMREDVLPYLSLPAVVGGGYGCAMGAHSVRHPQSTIQASAFKRVSIAFLEGAGAVFPFTLGEEITVYCAKPEHLDQLGKCMVSEATFWGEFFPPPSLLSGGFIIWSIIPPTKKLAWASHGRLQKGLVIFADSVFTTLLYSRIIQTSLMNISSIPQPLIYEFGAIPAGALVLIAQTLKPTHRQKLHTTMIYAMGANLMAYLIKSLIARFSVQSDDWSAILESVLLPILFVSGFLYTLWHFPRYVRELRTVERIMPAGSPRLLLQQQLDEALQRPEIRQKLMLQLLEDPQMKEELMRDPAVKQALMNDTDIREQLMKAAGFEEVDLGIERLSPRARNGSVSLTTSVDGRGLLEAEYSSRGLPTGVGKAPMLNAYALHQQGSASQLRALAYANTPSPNSASSYHDELLSPDNISPQNAAAVVPIGHMASSNQAKKDSVLSLPSSGANESITPPRRQSKCSIM